MTINASSLREALEWAVDPDSNRRIAALEFLRDHPGDGHAERVVPVALRDEDPVVVATALEYAVEEGYSPAIGAELARLVESREVLVRGYTLWAIGKFKLAEFLPLLDVISTRGVPADDGTRVAAAEAAFAISGQTSYAAIVFEGLVSTDPEVRAFLANSVVGVVAVDESLVDVASAHLRSAERIEPFAAIKERLSTSVELVASYGPKVPRSGI